MARTLSITMTTAKNQLESTDPLLWCFEFDDPGSFPVPVRFVSDLVPMTFQGNTFDPFPIDFSTFPETSLHERQASRALIPNVDQQIISLLESRWVGVAEPFWTLKVWRVLHSNPDTTPFASALEFIILSAQSDFLLVSFELQSARLPSNVRETGRRWLHQEFPHIPRLRGA